MKKIIPLIFIMMLLLTACGGGNTDNVEIPDWKPSEIYTDDEIESAFQTVEEYFSKEFNGCILQNCTIQGTLLQTNSVNGLYSMKQMKQLLFTHLTM